jgi:diguanylate cyclase (GGDEF)-like protein
MDDHGYAAAQVRDLDLAAEDRGAAALPQVQAEVDRLRNSADADHLVWLLPPLARCLAFDNQFDAAQMIAKEALVQFQQRGSARGQAMVLNIQAITSLRLGRIGPAIELVMRAGALARAANDAVLQIRIANTHGCALLDVGRLTEAIVVLEQGCQISVDVANEAASCRARANLGLALAKLAIKSRDDERPEQSWRPYAQRAVELFEHVASLLRHRGNEAERTAVMGNLALAYVALDRNDEAHATLDATQSFLSQKEQPHPIVPFHCIRARAYLQENRLSEALEAVDLARSLDDSRSARISLDEVYLLKSVIHERRGELDEALAAYKLFHGISKKLVLDRVERLHTESRHDSLTGLGNRRRFDEYLAGVLARASEAHPICLMLLDLDHFKAINDLHSHLVGDAALRWVSMQLEAVCRQTDLPVRLGGDEFAVVLSASSSVAQQVFTRLRAAVADPLCGLPAGVAVTLSAGIAEACASCDPQDFIASADRALYAAKAAGRNCVRVAQQ